MPPNERIPTPPPRPAQREVEQSIKARGTQLYQNDRPAAAPVDALPLEQRRPTVKPFSAYLAEAPAAPISPSARLALTAAGALVAGLLLASILF